MIAEKVFAEGVAKDIRNYLPSEYEDAEFQVVQKNKNNGIQLVGVQVNLPERNVSPIIYMEQFFDEIRQGEPVELVMNRIASCIEKSSRAPFMNSGIDLANYDSLKEHLAIKLVNTQANRKRLEEMPHENIEDLSLICYVDFPVDSREEKVTLEVKNQHLSIWNIDAKELFQQAKSNTHPVNTPVLYSTFAAWESLGGESIKNLLDENTTEFGSRSHEASYLLTNMEMKYGAAMITQPEVLEKLEKLFPEGFYILPSSIHEIVITPNDGERGPRMLGEMVRAVNQAEVDREEVLSDRIYSYDKEKHQIRQEPDSIQKAKEMER